jgi:hypothetical protein
MNRLSLASVVVRERRAWVVSFGDGLDLREVGGVGPDCAGDDAVVFAGPVTVERGFEQLPIAWNAGAG